MEQKETILKINKILEIGVGILLFIILFVWGIVQPITTQPDELTRYMIPYYIFSSGKLPNGNLPELLVRGYGISYGYFPCLPYICMAPIMKLVSIFTDSSYVILMGARVVNMLSGVITYIFIRRSVKLLTRDVLVGWLTTLLVCFWPQVLFIFTYTNCDAFAFMSCAIISYACILGIQSDWNRKSIAILSIGVAVCLLSYFNAYGMVLGAVVLFVLCFIKKDENGKTVFDCKNFLKIGLTIFAIVFVLAGWWFIRNAILYNGDFIGMEANRICAETNAVDYLKPSMKDTLKNNGGSIFNLLSDSSYMFLLKQSFFGRFGNMELAAPNYIIRFFKIMPIIGVIGLIIPVKRDSIGIKKIALIVGMVIAAIAPVFLCFYYSYADDYQPQGRYMLPGLVPIFIILLFGYEKINGLMRQFLSEKMYKYITTGIYICVFGYILLTTIGCLYLILRTYIPGLSETFSLIYTGNLYE